MAKSLTAPSLIALISCHHETTESDPKLAWMNKLAQE